MATLTKVLTSDGLLYYTLLLRNKFNTKADKTEIPSTIIVTPSSSNILLALSDGTTTLTAVALPIADLTNAGLMTPTMLSKLNGIATGAEVNVQSDWNQTTTTADDYIKNKPTIPQVLDSPQGTETNAAPSVNWVASQLSQVNEYIEVDGTSIDKNAEEELYVKQVDADKIVDGTTNKAYTGTEQTKLSGIEAGAQVNVLESIKVPVPSQKTGIVDLETLTISNKSVILPIADSSTYGLMTPDMVDKLSGNIIKGIIYNGSDLFINASTNKVTIPLDDSPTNNSNNLVKSSGVYSALALKAPLASPDFTGTPTAPTAASGTNSTQIATTAFVQAAISAAVTGSFKFVNSLPTTGEEGYIYLVPHTHAEGSTNNNPDVKDEYIWNTSASPAQWELIGNTDLDLSNYWSTTDLVALTTSEITTIWNTGMSND